jgi:transposase
MKPGSPEKMEFEYVRHGTQALIASFVVQSGEVFGKTYDRHTRYEFLDFMQDVAEKHPDKNLYFIMDNFRTHKTKEVMEWVESQEGRIHFHFTPTHASWLNQIELWFSILARKFLKRNIFDSVDDMVKKLMSYIEEYNRNAKPFRWTYAGEPLKI